MSGAGSGCLGLRGHRHALGAQFLEERIARLVLGLDERANETQQQTSVHNTDGATIHEASPHENNGCTEELVLVGLLQGVAQFAFEVRRGSCRETPLVNKRFQLVADRDFFFALGRPRHGEGFFRGLAETELTAIDVQNAFLGEVRRQPLDRAERPAIHAALVALRGPAPTRGYSAGRCSHRPKRRSEG